MVDSRKDRVNTMNKYRVVSTLWKLPKHQRRRFAGKAISKVVLGHNLMKEKSFYITSTQFDEARDQLQELYRRGEAEVRNPDGTLERFVKVEIKDPPPEKIEKLPPAEPIPGYSAIDIEGVSDIAPIEPKGKKKRKYRKRKNVETEDDSTNS